MKPKMCFSIVGLLVMTHGADLSAQLVRTVSPGARVRVTAPALASKKLVGTVQKLDADTLTLNVKGWRTPLLIPLRSLDCLEMSRERKSRFLQGLGAGVLVGIGAGLVGYGYGLQQAEDPDNPTSEEEAGAGQIGILAGLAVGLPAALIGGVIGAMLNIEKWDKIPIRKARLGLKPYGGRGLIFSASLSF